MKTNFRSRRRGTTFVEVLIAMLFATGVCAGLFKVGWQARRYSEHSRLSAEVRALAKEKLEEIASYSLDDLKTSDYWWKVETNTASTGAIVTRQPQIVWHKADGSAAGETNAVYAEVHVEVIFRSPLWEKPVTNSFPMIIN